MSNQNYNYVRGINGDFINDLKSGTLKVFLSLCKSSDYSLEIRKNYVNIYYKGGNAIKISHLKKGYTFDFDIDYCKVINNIYSTNCAKIASLNKYDTIGFFNNISLISNVMDNWFEIHKNNERKFQHSLTKNNHSNFQIIDIEYAIRDLERRELNRLIELENQKVLNSSGSTIKLKELFRLDMLAIYFENNINKLVIVENKFGDNLGGISGVEQHLIDINHILNNVTMKAQLISSVNSVLKNKHELGLLNNLVSFDENSIIEILFVLADYDNSITDFIDKTNAIQTKVQKKVITIPKLTDYSTYSIDYSKAKLL